MDFFVHITSLESQNRHDFEPLFKCCIKEIDLPLDSVIPYFVYQVGDNDGVIAYDIYGTPIAYVLYNKHDHYFINLIHFWVAPTFRRNKVATKMIAHIILKEQPHVMSSMINANFLPTQLLLKSLRFKCVKIICDMRGIEKYYFTTKDDGRSSRFMVKDEQ